jgi:hypothetical protein
MGTGLLPTIETELVVDFALAGTFPFTPTVALNDITVDLSTYFGVLGETLGEIGAVFDTAPFGQLFDAIMGPIPVIDDAAHAVPGLANSLDRVGNDDVVSLLDLAVLSGAADQNAFLDALVVINTIREISAFANLGEIRLGSLTLPTDISNAPGAFQGVGNPLAELDAAIRNKIKNQTGLELSLLEDPSIASLPRSASC